MSNQIQNPNDKKKYDLVERTAGFGQNIIIFLKSILENTISRPLISQLVRSATSIGANYMEADCSESSRDFNHKIGVCKKEAILPLPLESAEVIPFPSFKCHSPIKPVVLDDTSIPPPLV